MSTWMIDNANHLRTPRDGMKVGGHQSSSAGSVTLLTALYCSAMRPQDRIAVKPHASPAMHAMQYLKGRQFRDQLDISLRSEALRATPRARRTRLTWIFSTGSVGLGVAATIFVAVTRDYVVPHGFIEDDAAADGRMIALLGDAELDEGNIYEALVEGWKHEVKNLWWIIDYNRQSLDGVSTTPCSTASRASSARSTGAWCRSHSVASPR